MIYEFKYPVSVHTELGKGIVWYVRDGGSFENDIFCVVLCEDGAVKHFTSKQITVEKNGTFEIKNNPKEKQ